MTVKKYKIIKLFLLLFLIIDLTYSINSGNGFFAFSGLFLYMAILSLLKIKVKGVLYDERQIKVAEQASQKSFNILLPVLLLTSITLLVGSESQQFYYLKAIGIILAYITALSLFIYILTYFYYNKKSGGK